MYFVLMASGQTDIDRQTDTHARTRTHTHTHTHTHITSQTKPISECQTCAGLRSARTLLK